MANFYPTILKWNTSTVANGDTMSTTLTQLESNDNYLIGLINEMITDDGTVSYVVAINNTASTIAKGTPLYINGVVGDKIGVAPAGNTTQAKSTVIGISMGEIAPSGEGHVLLSGIMSDVDTTEFTAGTKIYLGSTDGTYTITEPTAPAYRVLIGNVINSSATGKIFVDITNSSPDYKVKYESSDTNPDYVINKITADGYTITRTNIDLGGGNKVGEFSSNGFIKVDVDDNDKSTWSHLFGSVDAGDNITLEIVEVSGKRKLKISSTAGQGDGDITGTGTATHLVKFTGEKTIADSKVIEDANGNLIIGADNNALGSNDTIVGSLNNRPAGVEGSIIVGNTNTDEGSQNCTLGCDNNVTGSAIKRITIGRGNTSDSEGNVTVGINNYANSGVGNQVVLGKNIEIDEAIDADVHIGGSKTQLHGTFIDKNGTVSSANKLLGFDSDGEAIIVDSVATIWSRTDNGTDAFITPIDGNDILNVQTIDLKVDGYPIPQAKEGRLVFEPTEKTVMMNPTDNDRIELGRSLYVRAINNSGVTIAKHSVVYLENNSGHFPTIKLADVSTLSKCHNIGVVTHDVDNGNEVEVQTYGVMQGFNTSAFEVTDFIYVSSTGTLTKIAPESPYIPMIVFTVLKKDTMDGWIYINPRIGFNSDSDIAYAFHAQGKVAGFDTITNYEIYNDYESNLVNIGEAFSSETGRFTIAKTGIYHFHASALFNQQGAVNSSTCNMWIRRYNSSDVEQESVIAFASTPATTDSHPTFSVSTNTIMNCSEGDYIGVVFYISGTGDNAWVNKVSFGGFTLTGLKGDQGPIGLTGPSGVTLISEAEDVTVTDIQTNDVLQWNGTKWANTNNPTFDSVKFNKSAGITAAEGEITWNSDDKTLDIGLDGTSVLQVGQEFLVKATNKTGSTITDGQAVYISGSDGQRVVVSLAQAINTPSNQVSLAIATQNIANNATGFFTAKGLVRGLNTSAFAEGDILYVSTTAGGLTNVAPAKPYSQLVIGIVTISNAGNGSIYVDPYPIPRINQLTDVVITSPTSGQTLIYNATTGLWSNGEGGGSGSDTYMLKLNELDDTAGFLLDKLTVADGSALTLSDVDGVATLDILEEDVSDPLIKTISLLVENGVNEYTGSCWSTTFADGEWGSGYSQNTTDSYYRLIPDARGTLSNVTVYVNQINGEDAYYGGYAGALRIGLFDASGTLKGATAWTRGITSVGTMTFDMVAESGQTLTVDRNTTYWVGIVGRGLTLTAHNKTASSLNLTTLRYSVRIRSASSGATWSTFLTSGTGYTENNITVVQMSAT